MAENRKRRDGWLKPSTRAFFAEGLADDNATLFDLLHGYFYGRFPHLYIQLGLGEHPLTGKVWPALRRMTRPARRAWRRLRPAKSKPATNGRWSMASGTHADGYHGKVIPLESARRLVSVKEDIRLPDLEQVIPYPRARALILQHPDHLAVLECPCRSAREHPCLPLDVCLIVGEPFVSFLLEHNPQRARRITQAEAARILEETDARGNVHHAFFKDAMLGRFYAICNCCDCCCGAIQSHRHGTPMLAASGYICRVDEDLCIGCGECASRCSFHAIDASSGWGVVDEAACMGCGVCVNGCDQGALTLELDPRKGLPLEIGTMSVLDPQVG